MKMRKLLALVLCLCLILPLCSAAFATGNEGEQNTDPTATPVADAENPPVETPVPSAVDDPEPDACTCGAEEGAAHAADCPLNTASGAASPSPAADPAEPTQSADPAEPTPAVSCTCDATDEEKAAEGFLHAEGCPLNVDTTAEDAQAFYDAIMACSSIEEVDVVMAKTGDGQSKKLYEALSDEAQAAMNAHIEKLHQAYLDGKKKD